MRRSVHLVPWAILGAALIAHHVTTTRRDASAAAVEERLRRARARLHAVIAIAKRIRNERNEALGKVVEQADFVRDIDKHGYALIRAVDHAYLREQRDRAATVSAELVHLRTALEIIADGCEAPQRLAADALDRGEEGACEAN